MKYIATPLFAWVLLLPLTLFSQGNTCASATDITSFFDVHCDTDLITFVKNTVVFSNAAATASGTNAPVSCIDGGGAVNDTWYSATIPPSGRVAFHFIPGNTFNPRIPNCVMQAYTGTCGALTALGTCSNADMQTYTGLTAGNTIYFQIWDKNSNSSGNIEFCLREPGTCPAGQSLVTFAHENEDGLSYQSYVDVVPSGNACGVGSVWTAGNTVDMTCASGGAGGAAFANSGFGFGYEVHIEEVCLTTGNSYDMYMVDDAGNGGNEVIIYVGDRMAGIANSACNGTIVNFSASTPSLGFPNCQTCAAPSCNAQAGKSGVIGLANDGAFNGGCIPEPNIPLNPGLEPDDITPEPAFTVCLDFTNPATNDGAGGGYITGYCLLFNSNCLFGAASVSAYDDMCNALTQTGTTNIAGINWETFGLASEIVGGNDYTVCFTYNSLISQANNDCQVLRILPAIVLNATVLPVEYTLVRGYHRDEVNYIEWITQDELDTRSFEIQRRHESSEEFITVGTVEANGNPNGSEYLFIDSEPLTGKSMYRIRNIDINGGTDVSGIVEIFVDPTGAVKIFPNPFGQTMQLHIKGIKDNARLELFTVQGQQVYRQDFDHQSPERQEIDLAHLASGVYLYKVRNGDQVFSGKISKTQ